MSLSLKGTAYTLAGSLLIFAAWPNKEVVRQSAATTPAPAQMGHGPGRVDNRTMKQKLDAVLIAGAEENAAPKWQYIEQPDKMRGSILKVALVESENVAVFNFPYHGGSHMSLGLRKSPRSGSSVMLSIDPGQFVCSWDDCSVQVKFDGGKVESVGVSRSADGSHDLLFIDGHSRFVAKLKKAQTVTVEADFFQSGPRQFEFDVAGLVWK